MPTKIDLETPEIDEIVFINSVTAYVFMRARVKRNAKSKTRLRATVRKNGASHSMWEDVGNYCDMAQKNGNDYQRIWKYNYQFDGEAMRNAERAAAQAVLEEVQKNPIAPLIGVTAEAQKLRNLRQRQVDELTQKLNVAQKSLDEAIHELTLAQVDLEMAKQKGAPIE